MIMEQKEITTEKKNRNNATITFSQKGQKEQMLQYLNSKQLQSIMPDSIRGKDCQMVLWAVEYLHRLFVDGKLCVQEEEPAEKKVITIDNANSFIGKLTEVLLKTGAILNKMALQVDDLGLDEFWQLHYLAESRDQIDFIRQDLQRAIDKAENEQQS